jgi:hypothetical protein|tara:strand:- start:1290 stop:1505 length:216 start_codon:yes stop_codon:yes gene_type:complete
MSSQYKDNIFSTEKFSISNTRTQNNINKTTKPNIDHLIKRILDEKKREKKNIMALGFISLSVVLLFFVFQN